MGQARDLASKGAPSGFERRSHPNQFFVVYLPAIAPVANGYSPSHETKEILQIYLQGEWSRQGVLQSVTLQPAV